MKIAIYPGTFDPITNGHLDILERALKLFDKVIITVATNSTKTPLFSESERLAMIRKAIAAFNNVEVDLFHGLMVSYARKKHATAVVRGLRATSDFEYELQMALMNRKLDDKIVTVFLMPNEKYTYLNSSIVKEIARHGGNVKQFVPSFVLEALKKRLFPTQRKNKRR
ncbi:MAG: pantetheine-phosphate adenylyltransferase [bacterium]